MENTKAITALTDEGKVVNEVAAYLTKHGKFNAIKIANMVFEALEKNNTRDIEDAEKEIIRQCIDNMRTLAIWEKWGE